MKYSILGLIITLLLSTQGKATETNMETLITETHKSSEHRPKLLNAIMSGEIVIIASWENLESQVIKIQDFVRNGQLFIPVFSDVEHFKAEIKGSGFEDKGVSIDANLFASMLNGFELIILNPGSNMPIEIHAKELKSKVDLEKLPK